jgi:hypothetical protein
MNHPVLFNLCKLFRFPITYLPRIIQLQFWRAIRVVVNWPQGRNMGTDRTVCCVAGDGTIPVDTTRLPQYSRPLTRLTAPLAAPQLDTVLSSKIKTGFCLSWARAEQAVNRHGGPGVLASHVAFPNSRQILIFVIRERGIEIPEMILFPIFHNILFTCFL